MDHSENISTMVRPSTPGSSLGSTPNLALSQDNYPSLSKSSSNNKRQRAESDDENQSFFKPDNFPKFLVIKSNTESPEFAYRLAVVRGLNSHGGLYF